MTSLRNTDMERCNIMKSELTNPNDFNMLEEGEEVRLQRGEPCCSNNNHERNPQWGFFLGMALSSSQSIHGGATVGGASV